MHQFPQITNYTILRAIGRGAMGVVYEAVYDRLEHRRAIKVMHAHLTSDVDLRERFLREAKILAKFTHDNIVDIYDFGIVEGTEQPFLVMELVEGRPLDRILDGKPLSLAATLAIIRPLANALDYAHKQGVVHRDVKPANILRNLEGKILLTDFGVAVASDLASMTVIGGQIGTAKYMASEVCKGEKASRSSDIYALGILVYEMLTGKPPFEGTVEAVIHKQIYEPPPDPREQLRSIPAGAAAALLQCLDKNPAKRFRTAGEFVLALARNAPPPRLESLRNKARDLAKIVAIIGLLTVFGLAAYIVGPSLLQRTEPPPPPPVDVEALEIRGHLDDADKNIANIKKQFAELPQTTTDDIPQAIKTAYTREAVIEKAIKQIKRGLYETLISDLKLRPNQNVNKYIDQNKQDRQWLASIIETETSRNNILNETYIERIIDRSLIVRKLYTTKNYPKLSEIEKNRANMEFRFVADNRAHAVRFTNLKFLSQINVNYTLAWLFELNAFVQMYPKYAQFLATSELAFSKADMKTIRSNLNSSKKKLMTALHISTSLDDKERTKWTDKCLNLKSRLDAWSRFLAKL